MSSIVELPLSVLGEGLEGLYVRVYWMEFQLPDGSMADVEYHALTSPDQLRHALLFNRDPPEPWPKETYWLYKLFKIDQRPVGRLFYIAYYTSDIEIQQARRKRDERNRTQHGSSLTAVVGGRSDT